MITEIADGVYTVAHRVAEGKNAVIVGERGAWAIDTGSEPSEGQLLIDLIQQQGYAADRLIYTHGHGDHVLGSRGFQEAEVFAHALTPIEIRRLLPMLAERAGGKLAELAAQIAWPTITFRDELFLDLGGKHLHLFPTPGHSQDGISIYLEEEKLLIAGDAVVTGIVPAIGDGDSVVLEATLRELAQVEIEVLVPGHGEVVYGREQVQDWLTWLPTYLYDVRAFVQQALHRGTPPAEIPELCNFSDFIGDRLPQDKQNMPKRHQATVGKIVQECLEHL